MDDKSTGLEKAKRFPDLTLKQEWELIKTTPNVWLVGGAAGAGGLLDKTSGITFYIICGIALVLFAFATAHIIKQRKKLKRGQAPSNDPGTA